MDVYNLSFDESQQRIIYVWRNQLLDDHVSPKNMEESVIVSDVRRQKVTMVDAFKA